MPELPEVETIRRDLVDLLTGREIIGVDLLNPGSVRGALFDGWESLLIGKRFTGVRRRAKLLILNLDSRDSLLFHLKMSGRLIYAPRAAPLHKHTRLILRLRGEHDLRFVDMRKFGYMKLVGAGGLSAAAELTGLGPEPLGQEFTADQFMDLLAAKQAGSRSTKALLMDQTFIAGIGNIYADEILFSAGVDPRRPVGSITRAEGERLYRSIRRVLSEAVANRGTSFSQYVDAAGKTGRHFERLRVYGRQGKPCDQCGQPLLKIRLTGRGTHYCSFCQR